MKKKLRGSYTVEAAFVMALVLWAIMVSVQASFKLRDETVGAMALQCAVQRLRHGEEEEPDRAARMAGHMAGTPFSWRSCQFGLKKKGNPIIGYQVSGTGEGGDWRLEIKQDKFDPENFLRMLTLTDREE